MNFSKNKKLFHFTLISISFVIVTAILWNTYDFFQKFKEEERIKMEIIVAAQKDMAENPLSNMEVNLPLKILNSNKKIPMIITNKQGEITFTKNLDSLKEKDSAYLFQQLKIMKSNNKPIQANYKLGKEEIIQTLYYKDSDLLTKLKYYPLALLLILALFASVIYLVIKSTRIAEQNKLWAGMAKETAHQIGTPLSSLLGWVEILRMDKVDEETVSEIEKDITRLNTIADRFSKIGSIPVLERINLVEETQKSYDYLKSRSSKQVVFSFKTDSHTLFVDANKQLFSWVIENIIKNAIDAIQGKGKLMVEITSKKNSVNILISDTGKGIPKSEFKKIFETGFTTKKRGWGLGLSLAKRIIEDYHNGDIFVKKSVIGKGTSIAINLKRVV